MKKIIIITSLSIFFLTACKSDGVPNIENPHNIVVDGQKITQSDFLQKYCVGIRNNKTCEIVQNAMMMDATKGEVPRF